MKKKKMIIRLTETAESVIEQFREDIRGTKK